MCGGVVGCVCVCAFPTSQNASEWHLAVILCVSYKLKYEKYFNILVEHTLKLAPLRVLRLSAGGGGSFRASSLGDTLLQFRVQTS